MVILSAIEWFITNRTPVASRCYLIENNLEGDVRATLELISAWIGFSLQPDTDYITSNSCNLMFSITKSPSQLRA